MNHYRFFIFLSSVLFLYDAQAASGTLSDCPQGCFCLHAGKFDAKSTNIEEIKRKCSRPAKLKWSTGNDTATNYCKATVADNHNTDYAAKYFLDDFSEFFTGELGFYGFKSGEFVSVNECPMSNGYYSGDAYDNIFQCPQTHPNSAKNSKGLTDCFKYNENGQRLYYGSDKAIDNSQSLPGALSGTLSDCPEGCFCLNAGKFDADNKNIEEIKRQCSGAARLKWSTGNNTATNYCKATVADNHNTDYGASYFLDDFSEFYEGKLGVYGFKNGEFVYINECPMSNGYYSGNAYDSIFQCPDAYPYSAKNSQGLTDCFKYNESGKKIYYGSDKVVHCEIGSYLPANSDKCKVCEPSKNHVCPGGKFKKDKLENQGLKINCNPGQYLPANAISCKTCDDRYYVCQGGIYNTNLLENQGQIKHNGYINIVNKQTNTTHKTTTCDPGYYMQAKTTKCTVCPDDKICPGGMFYIDGEYTMDRGTMLCSYGFPNNTHTECTMETTSSKTSKKSTARSAIPVAQKVESYYTSKKETNFSTPIINTMPDSTRTAKTSRVARFISNIHRTQNIKQEQITRSGKTNRKQNSRKAVFYKSNLTTPDTPALIRQATKNDIKRPTKTQR